MFTARKAGRWLALWLWLRLAARGAAQVPCSVTHSLAPGEERVFHFQRAGDPGPLLCSFVFQAPLGATIAVGLLSFDSESMQPDCDCAALRMYNVSLTGELQLSDTKCAGESADGDVLYASGNVAMVTLSTNDCPAPSFSLVVGASEDVDAALAATPTAAEVTESTAEGADQSTSNGTSAAIRGTTEATVGDNSTESADQGDGRTTGQGSRENTTMAVTPPSGRATTPSGLGPETGSTGANSINSTGSNSPTRRPTASTAPPVTLPPDDIRRSASGDDSSPAGGANGGRTTTKRP